MMDHPGPARPLLNSSQQRALAITLRLVEEHLAAISGIVERDVEGLLYRRARPRLTIRQVERIDRLLAEARSSIGATAGTFALRREERGAAGEIRALLAMSWQSLGEIDARGMRAYGDTDPALGQRLDLCVQHLMDLALELEVVVPSR